MFELNNITRKNIRNLIPYSSARSEYKGKSGIFLDANENPFGSPLEEDYNRYPDPLQLELKQKICGIKKCSAENIFLGNGSDEAIDILFRAFCDPGRDNVIICPPTYGMYEVAANINDVEVKKVPLLDGSFQIDVDAIQAATDENTKLIFFCCPNNPTGTSVKWKDVQSVLEYFKGIVVMDEAYIDFASYESLIPTLKDFPNLVILQTFSKAWGLAGVRLGMAFASEEIITIFNKVKPPYNISSGSQKLVMEALKKSDLVMAQVKETIAERQRLLDVLSGFSFVIKGYPSEANFILVKTEGAEAIYEYLTANGIIVRNRSRIALCEGCLRITIGTKEENELLVNALTKFRR